MTEYCKAKFLFTREELKRAMRHHYEFKLRRIHLLMRIFAVLLLVFIGLVLVAWLTLPSTSAPPFWAFFLLAVFSLYLLFMIRFNTWNSTRAFEKRPDANSEIEWEFSGEEIKTRSALGEGTIVWKYFSRVIEVRDGFLFYPIRNLFHWVPFSAFNNPSCVEIIRGYLIENGITLVAPRSNKRLERTRQ